MRLKQRISTYLKTAALGAVLCVFASDRSLSASEQAVGQLPAPAPQQAASPD
jgi:hypothetical protein